MSPPATPIDIGIQAIELYFPSTCVDQTELEKYDGVSAGKYTIGLGQKKMGFCDDREDIYSLALTTVSRLLKKNNIDPRSIGRLEVGTETLLDKSKSVKSVLMQLFAPSGNNDIEGVDNINACYGGLHTVNKGTYQGTNALFNALNWIESSSWDGRNAIVVAGDIALYAKGAARPTGGAGCVALLIAPGAPIVIESGLRGTFMAHAYDFYKPDPRTEYPYVDGQFSLQCYTKALDECYKSYNSKIPRFSPHSQNKRGVDRFDFNKSYARMLYNDYLQNPSSFPQVTLPQMTYDQSITSKEIEKVFMDLSKEKFEQRVKAGLYAPQNVGNMYTATVYACLASLISETDSKELIGKRIGFYSYGSGLASSFFSAVVKADTSQMARNINLRERLEARKVVEPALYDKILEQRYQAHLQKDFTPQGDINQIETGAYYLTKVDDMYRRSYSIKS